MAFAVGDEVTCTSPGLRGETGVVHAMLGDGTNHVLVKFSDRQKPFQVSVRDLSDSDGQRRVEEY